MPEANRLTVVQVLPALDSGGVEKGTLEIASKLAEVGHRSVVISAGGQLVAQLLNQGSEHITLPVDRKSLSSLRQINKLKSVFTESRASIVHARSRLPAWLCFLALKGIKGGHKPVFITTVHGIYSVNRYSKIMTRGERIIAISEFVREYITQNYPDTDANKITVIPRGIDPSFYRYGHRPTDQWQKAWFEQFPETQNKLLITLPARITRWKGQDDFIEIMNILRDRPELHGIIVGSPHKDKQKYLKILSNKIHRRGLTGRITFTGRRDDIKEIMSISNIVLSLSTSPEAFGRTSLEALSLGIPVIAYSHGGTREVIENIFPQGLVPVNDIQKAADKVAAFIIKPPTVMQQNRYILESMQNQTVALYESAVNPSI